MPDAPDYKAWFDDYARSLTESLGKTAQVDRIRGFYADTALALGQDGSLKAAQTGDDAFADMLRQMNDFYAAIGTQRIVVDHVETDEIAPAHDRVRVFYRGDYRKADGEALSIPFDVTYLVQRRETGPVIFAFIAGDEGAVFQDYGLVDAQGRPAGA